LIFLVNFQKRFQSSDESWSEKLAETVLSTRNKLRDYYLDTIFPNPPRGYTPRNNVRATIPPLIMSESSQVVQPAASTSSPSHHADSPVQTTSLVPASFIDESRQNANRADVQDQKGFESELGEA
jgi:hypothetical protein